MKTKLLKPIWLAAMLLLLSSVPLTANAHDFEVGGIYYLIDGTNATVTYRGSSYNEYSNEYSGNVVIPESVTYNGATYSVTSIGNYAFQNCSSLTSVTIGNSVISIGFAAFWGCSGLTSVTIGNSVTSIGEDAFYGCTGLTSVHITDLAAWCNIAFGSSAANPLNYAHHLFLNGTEVKDLVIPNSVTSIGFAAFWGCSGLTSFTIPNSVTSIGEYTFYKCSGLTSITIPNSVTSIGFGAFWDCSGLTSITLTGQGAWSPISDMPNIDQIKTVNIGSGITSLDNFGFTPDVVNCYAEVPPTCTSSTFANYDGELHVPTNALVPYMTANYWQNFSNLNNDITEKVTLNTTSATLIQHEELQLVATATPNNSAVIWSSTNQNVATVDNNGKVTAKEQGECDIFATLVSNPAVHARCHITASYPEITSLTLSETELVFNQAGDTITLVATAIPDDTGVKPTWTSSDETVATVDANGLVTATGQGECDITATVLNQSATCHVTVNSTIVITLDQHEMELDLNHMAVLTPTCSPAETDLTVTSSDPSVVFARMVTQNGTAKVQLVGMKQGEATITVASVDGKAIPDSCVVTVVRRVGDLNADGYINVMDITTLIELIMGNVDAPDDAEMPYCDVKADGEINVMDITALIDIIMNS